MQQRGIRERSLPLPAKAPDSIALHPGYELFLRGRASRATITPRIPVARMQQRGIRERSLPLPAKAPDSIALHPVYELFRRGLV
jgi:hypothetical protein